MTNKLEQTEILSKKDYLMSLMMGISKSNWDLKRSYMNWPNLSICSCDKRKIYDYDEVIPFF